MTSFNTSNAININVSMACFIIPNEASEVSYLFSSSKEELEKLAGLNNTFVTENDKCVDIWLHNEVNDNILDHGLVVENTLYWVDIPGIPEKMLSGKKEGDVITLRLPAHRDGDGSRGGYHAREVVITAQITLQQDGYRYSRFGEFHDLLRLVCR